MSTIWNLFQNDVIRKEYESLTFSKFIRYYKNGIPEYTGLRSYENDVTDQMMCINDFLTKRKIIVNQFCGWGKSFIPTFFFKLCLEMKLNRYLNRPLIFVMASPLTSLSKGNQLDKDLQTLFVDSLDKKYNIKFCGLCTGNNLTNTKSNIEDLTKRYLHDKSYDKNEFRKYYYELANIFEDINEVDKINQYVSENEYDAIIIYTCDNSLCKLNKLNPDLIDFLSLDEAHVHFLNGGNNRDDETECIVNSVMKLVDSNSNMMVRSWTATPTYLEGCKKSTWYRKMWGPEITYASYSHAVKLGWALPIKWHIFDTIDITGKRTISFEDFLSMFPEKKTFYIFKTAIEVCNEYKKLEGSMKTAKLIVKCQETDDFKNIYKLFDDWEKNVDNFESIYKNNPIYNFVKNGNTVLATTSAHGLVMLTKNGIEKFNGGIPEFIVKSKTDDFNENFLNNDVIFFNIKQLSTGHDLNFFNCGLIFANCYEDDFVQFIFRSGRSAKGKFENKIFISSMCCSTETCARYKGALSKLIESTDAFEGTPHIIGWTGVCGAVDEIKNDQIIFDEKIIQIECNECGKADSRYKDYTKQELWDQYRRENRVDARKHWNDEAYKNMIVNRMLQELNREIKANRVYCD